MSIYRYRYRYTYLTDGRIGHVQLDYERSILIFYESHLLRTRIGVSDLAIEYLWVLLWVVLTFDTKYRAIIRVKIK